MTAPGEDVLAWLDTAITHHDEVARAAATEEQDPSWSNGGEYSDAVYASGVGSAVVVGPWGYLADATRKHIATNDPASVLRRCAADRKLLHLHGGNMHSCPATDETDFLDEWTQFGYGDVCPVVQLLADSYGWTPDTASAPDSAQTSPIEGDQMT